MKTFGWALIITPFVTLVLWTVFYLIFGYKLELGVIENFLSIYTRSSFWSGYFIWTMAGISIFYLPFAIKSITKEWRGKVG